MSTTCTKKSASRTSSNVDLKESTIKDNSRFFNSIDEVPTHAMTMGIKNILNAKKVLCYEIDEDMVEVLKGELSFDNLKIQNVDFLKANLEEDFSYFNDCERVIVASNLPYYITTPIIMQFIENSKNIKAMVIMVQEEVAYRLASKESSSDYGAITVAIALRGQARITRNVSRKMFIPAPNVDSAIVKIDIIKNKQDYNSNRKHRAYNNI